MNVSFHPLDPESWEWVFERIDPLITKTTKGVVAKDNGKILAAAIFDNWTITSAHIHLIIENSFVLRHGFIEEVMNYFFSTADKEILIGVTPSNNKIALKFNTHIGFVELFRIKDGFMFGVDLVFQELRKADCRWIADGKTKYSAAA